MLNDVNAIVVGGGIVGLSTAYHLALAGCRKTTVLEKSAIGSGASGQSNACIRSNYSHRELAEMAVHSLRRMPEFATEFGVDPDFRRSGYMVLVDQPNEAAARHSVEIQRAAGAHTRFISPKETGEVVPWMYTGDIAGAIYEADAGFVEPSFVLDGIAGAARRLGVEIQTDVRVLEIVAGPDRRPAVRTIDGLHEADLVLNAAGSWAPGLQPAEAPPLPVKVFRHQIGLLHRPSNLPETGPIVVDMVNDLSYRPDTGLMLRVGTGSSNEVDRIKDPDRYNRSIDHDRLALVAEGAVRRFPPFIDAGYAGGYSAINDLSPDSHFILGPIDGFDGYHVAAGMSGHAFKHGLLLGQGLADVMLTGGTKAFDFDLFAPDRFGRGALIRPEMPYTRGPSHLGGPPPGEPPPPDATDVGTNVD